LLPGNRWSEILLTNMNAVGAAEPGDVDPIVHDDDGLVGVRQRNEAIAKVENEPEARSLARSWSRRAPPFEKRSRQIERLPASGVSNADVHDRVKRVGGEVAHAASLLRPAAAFTGTISATSMKALRYTLPRHARVNSDPRR
jgi:hypothetical protein